MKHGHGKRNVKRSPEYSAWMDMRARCTSIRHKFFHIYGARGISICADWNEFSKFFSDMGPRPGKGFSLDRINVNSGYSKENCRWADRETQDNNKQNSLLVTWQGETLTAAQWDRRLSLTKGTVKTRLKLGWDLERIFTEPVSRFRKRTVCKNGHSLTGDNLYVTSQGARVCRQCFLEYQKNYNRNRRAA